MGDRVNRPSHCTRAFRPRCAERVGVTRRTPFGRGDAIKCVWRAGLKDRGKSRPSITADELSMVVQQGE